LPGSIGRGRASGAAVGIPKAPFTSLPDQLPESSAGRLKNYRVLPMFMAQAFGTLRVREFDDRRFVPM
jgi:hypothetical protein